MWWVAGANAVLDMRRGSAAQCASSSYHSPWILSMRSRLSILSLPVFGALALAGCAGQQPAPQSAPAPAATTAAAATPGRQMKPEETEIYTPVPKVVTPGTNGSAPSDAVVLFNGSSLDEWVLSKDKSPAT